MQSETLIGAELSELLFVGTLTHSLWVGPSLSENEGHFGGVGSQIEDAGKEVSSNLHDRLCLSCSSQAVGSLVKALHSSEKRPPPSIHEISIHTAWVSINVATLGSCDIRAHSRSISNSRCCCGIFASLVVYC